MDLPDCPPGAEGYQDSVTEVPKKPEDTTCTKAEQEFQDHLNSLKIKIDDGSYRCMVERRGRDVSGKWIYLCYPCAAVCSGEAILQTHISGKKHKSKLSMKNIWPMSIFSDHPYNQSENANKMAATPKVLQKMAEEVELHKKSASEMDQKYGRLQDVRCHIQDTLDEVTTPLIGVEYLIEHPPQEAHYEPSYTCTLCYKQGHPRTIVNHMTCFWHRHNYLQRHYTKAADLLKPFRQQLKYRDGVAFIMNRIAQRIVEKYGRMKPINIDKEEYDKEKERIHQWIFKGAHFAETKDCTFEEVVDIDLINTLYRSNAQKAGIKDPSPPIVAVPKPNNSNRVGPAGAAARRERRVSMESLSDLSDELDRYVRKSPESNRFKGSRIQIQAQKARFEPYPDKGRDVTPLRGKYAARNAARKAQLKSGESAKRQPNYEYKLQVASDRRQAVEDAANKSLAYHEKNPEKHPLYPEEWKKFWNRRYKEIQAEGKDPSKHDFKPEWIVFWTGRMKELHKEELRLQVVEIYRKMCLSPPPAHDEPLADKRRKTPELKDARRRSPDPKDRKRSLEPRRRTPPSFRGGPDGRRRSPDSRRRSPLYRRDHRSPVPHHRRSPPPPPRRHSPLRVMRSRSRSPMRSLRSPPRTHIVLESRGSRSPLSRREISHRNRSPAARIRSPAPRNRSPVRRRTRSPGPGSPRSMPRNRSPGPRNRSPGPRNRSAGPRNRSPGPRNRSPEFLRGEGSRHNKPRNRSPVSTPLNTVLISDDELKPDEVTSPWNSDNSLESLGSLPDARSPPSPPRSRTGSLPARHAGGGAAAAGADNVVATLRMLVALEDYLGSLGPKIVDLLAEAIRMEKEKANSSEELLERETAVVLIETAKEKLKGAAQAGLVAPAAAAAVRAAVVRAAATLHEADKRARQLKAESSKKAAAGVAGAGAAAAGGAGAAVPVAGVGAVDRAQIAQQMAAALVAQGKTDVSEEELAQLVDAVVGMAEAKKREADEKKQLSARFTSLKGDAVSAAAVSGTASALQMLQSAYDDKRCEKDDVRDAMDGLSDSDLETLLKNFNELSAEEQHSLIAYLKKLEAREPQRVERLRQYVSAAAAYAPARATHAPPDPDVPPAPAPARDPQLVAIESDDDDYTVEEVFKSAKEKVKEDKIRQEMEIVKKSLEESNVTASEAITAQPSYVPVSSTNINLANHLSSAANLLALVQASLQSANKPVQAAGPPVADVVTSNTQPRSFGDKPDAGNQGATYVASQANYVDRSQNQAPFNHQDGSRLLQNLNYLPSSSNTSNETRLGGSIPNINDEPRFGTIVHNPLTEPRFDGNNPLIQRDQMFGGNNANIQNEPRFPGNNRMHNEPLLSNPNVYNEPPSYKGPMWETRHVPNMAMGPPRDQGFNNYPQDNTYNQEARGSQGMYNQRPQTGSFNNINRIQENYDARPQNTNQPQYGNQVNHRGRGGNFGNRGRGRGRGTW